MPNPTAPRRLRLCTACMQVDDHPRHVIDGQSVTGGAVSPEVLDGLPDRLPARSVTEALADNLVIRHIDCCAAAGCVQCQATEAVTAGARGLDLLAALAKAKADGFTEPEITDMKELGHHG